MLGTNPLRSSLIVCEGKTSLRRKKVKWAEGGASALPLVDFEELFGGAGGLEEVAAFLLICGAHA